MLAAQCQTVSLTGPRSHTFGPIAAKGETSLLELSKLQVRIADSTHLDVSVTASLK